MAEACFEYWTDLVVEPKAPVKKKLDQAILQNDDSENQRLQKHYCNHPPNFFDQIWLVELS